MWKSLAKVSLTCLLSTPVLAADPPAPSTAQPTAPKSVTSVPGGNSYADPFFAPPGSGPVMDPDKPGSGAVASDSMVPPPHPFRPERMWLAPDFLFAAGQGTLLPPLVTSAPNGTPLGVAGALNQPTTTTLFGGERALQRMRPGMRVNGGVWLTEDYRFGVDATVLFLGDIGSTFSGTTGPTGSILAQPVTLGGPGVQVGIPVGTTSTGSISARAHSAVIGGDANFRYGITTSELGRLDVLVGYRYLNLRDRVEVGSLNSPNLAAINTLAGVPIGDTAISDNFRTMNQFHGAQIGLGGTHRLFDRLTLTTKATVAIGVNISDVTISGQTFSPTGTTSGGLLTGASNMGNFRDSYFAVVPEGNVKLGWDFTDRLRVNAGYSFLYWTKVRRAADHIDTTIQVPFRPAFSNDSTSYWIQGWTVGLDLRY